MTINMTKPGQTVNMKKSGGVIKAVTSWVKNKDYDIAADVVYYDGRVETVVTYPTEEGGVPVKMATDDGSVRHLGDVKRQWKGRPSETLEIDVDKAKASNVRAVVIWGYSARANGAGSFKRYEVELRIDNGDETVVMPPEHMSNNEGVYTLVIGTIHITPEAGVIIEKLEQYSNGGERRPKVTFNQDNGEVEVAVDKGETNVHK